MVERAAAAGTVWAGDLVKIVVRVVFSVGLGAEAGIVVRTSVGFGAGGGWGWGLH